MPVPSQIRILTNHSKTFHQAYRVSGFSIWCPWISQSFWTWLVTRHLRPPSFSLHIFDDRSGFHALGRHPWDQDGRDAKFMCCGRAFELGSYRVYSTKSDSLMISSYLDIPPISQSPCLIISFQTCNQNEYFFQKFYGPLEMPSLWLSHLMVRDFEHFLSSVRINLPWNDFMIL